MKRLLDLTLNGTAREDAVSKNLLLLDTGTVAGPSHRETATLGGNLCLDTRCVFYNQSAWWRAGNAFCLKYKGTICHAAYSGDLAPALLVLGAEAEFVGPAGSRHVPLAGTTALVGLPLEEATPQQLDKLVQKQVSPMRTTMALAHYRRRARAAARCSALRIGRCYPRRRAPRPGWLIWVKAGRRDQHKACRT